MACSNFLFPGNPKKREKVIRLHQELINCIDSNFDVTNDLIGLLNTNLGCKITPIKMKEDGTIKEHCDIFTETMKKIQEVLQKIDEEMKKKLDPSLYLKLHDVTESDTTKMKIIQSAASILNGLVGIAASGIIMKLIFTKITFAAVNKVVVIMAKIGASAFGLVAGALIVLGVDVILGAVLGAIEKSQLDKAIQELDHHLNEFKPASREYQKAITRIICTVPDKI